MTGTEIKQAADAYIDETIDDPDAVRAINRGISKIGDMALIDETMEIEADRQTWVELPEEITIVVEVVDAFGMTYEGFRIRGNNLIWFDEAGTYTVHYRRVPRPIGGILATPEIHPAYHQCLVTYLIAWWKLKDDDENPDGIRHEDQFKDDVQRVFNSLRRKRTPACVRVIR